MSKKLFLLYSIILQLYYYSKLYFVELPHNDSKSLDSAIVSQHLVHNLILNNKTLKIIQKTQKSLTMKHNFLRFSPTICTKSMKSALRFVLMTLSQLRKFLLFYSFSLFLSISFYCHLCAILSGFSSFFNNI